MLNRDTSQTNSNDGQLTEAEIADIERIHAEEMQAVAYENQQRDYAYETQRNMDYEIMCFEAMEAEYEEQTPTFRVRVQRIDLIELDVRADTIEEGEEKALKILGNAPELGEVLRVDFGHRTIERV